ncbi:hypothetical protein [Streptomyces ehimensis]|uniref:Uncharacterized protein n=1 Tax=Streptomyces ehimensis TaxID=68195 RepID=A0ABV9BQD8_9ACTN
MATNTTDIDPGSDPTTLVLKYLGGVVLWVFAAFTFLLLPLNVMASDGCFDGDTRAICTVAGQNAVAYVPMVTAPLAGVLGTYGLAAEGGRARGLYAVAMGMLVAAWVVVSAIAG